MYERLNAGFSDNDGFCAKREEGMGVKMENSYFNEALSNFTKDFAYGGAIRHLVDKGYTAERIIKEFNYPLSRESIEKMVNDYSQKK